MHVQTTLATALRMGQDVANTADFPMFARRVHVVAA